MFICLFNIQQGKELLDFFNEAERDQDFRQIKLLLSSTLRRLEETTDPTLPVILLYLAKNSLHYFNYKTTIEALIGLGSNMGVGPFFKVYFDCIWDKNTKSQHSTCVIKISGRLNETR
jgi:hypothetical protein